MSYIKKFNPYDLPEETLKAIATGRERVLEDILSLIARNAEGGLVQHLQVVAPRGYGKSFLMRMVQSALRERVARGLPVALALLPEEQHNVDAPHRLLNEIQRVLEDRPASSLLGGAFSESDGAWESAVAELDAAIHARLPEGRGIAVAIIENFDQLISDIFSKPRDQSRLRALLARPGGRLMLLATATRQADADYEQRLFQATRVIELEPWKEESCLAFFEKLRGQGQAGPMPPRTLGKARAIAQFIGGSPRMATVLAEVLDSNDSLQAAQILDALVDELTPYYKHRIESLSRRARTVLDALLRMGEPRTQSEIAARLGTVQARIAEPFNELRSRGEVVGVKAQHSAEVLYRVGDRLMAHYYRRRHLSPGEAMSLLEGIVELLANFYTPEEKQEEAKRLREMGRMADAAVMDRLVAADLAQVDSARFGTVPGDDWLDQLEERIWALVDADQIDEAISLCQEAVKRAESSGDLRAQVHIQRCLGWLLFRRGQHVAAEEVIRRALALAKQMSDIGEQAQSSRLLGWSLGQLKRHAEAEEILRRAIALAEKVGDFLEQVQSSRLLGQSLSQLGRHTEAEETLRQAIALAERAGDAAQLAWAAMTLLDVAKASGDDATFFLSWQHALVATTSIRDNDDLPSIALWFSYAVVPALRLAQFGAVWSTSATLPIDEIELWSAQSHLATEVVKTSWTRGRAAAYTLVAHMVEVLAQNALERTTRGNPAGPDPIAFLRGFLSRLTLDVTDPALLRDIAVLLEQRLPAETAAERALLEAAAKHAENPDDPAALERQDPDIATALRRLRNFEPSPAPPPSRKKRSGTTRRKK